MSSSLIAKFFGKAIPYYNQSKNTLYLHLPDVSESDLDKIVKHGSTSDTSGKLMLNFLLYGSPLRHTVKRKIEYIEDFEARAGLPSEKGSRGLYKSVPNIDRADKSTVVSRIDSISGPMTLEEHMLSYLPVFSSKNMESSTRIKYVTLNKSDINIGDLVTYEELLHEAGHRILKDIQVSNIRYGMSREVDFSLMADLVLEQSSKEKYETTPTSKNLFHAKSPFACHLKDIPGEDFYIQIKDSTIRSNIKEYQLRSPLHIKDFGRKTSLFVYTHKDDDTGGLSFECTGYEEAKAAGQTDRDSVRLVICNNFNAVLNSTSQTLLKHYSDHTHILTERSYNTYKCGLYRQNVYDFLLDQYGFVLLSIDDILGYNAHLQFFSSHVPDNSPALSLYREHCIKPGIVNSHSVAVDYFA